MSATSKIDTNRRNEATSSAPKTLEGRAAARSNTVSNRSLADVLVLQTESRADLEEMYEALKREYQPSGAIEMAYLEWMLAAKWRVRRIQRIEAAMHALRSKELKDQADPAAHARTASTSPEAFVKFARYRASIERSFRKSRNELLRLKTERTQQGKSQRRASA